MVRHLEHVSPQVHASGHQPLLDVGPEVTGEQDAHPPLAGAQDHAQLVGFGRRGGLGRLRRQYLEAGVTDRADVAGLQHDVPAAGPVDQPVQSAHPIVGGCERRGRDRAHLPPGQRTGQPVRVVGVQVREQHERQTVDTEPTQTPVDEGRIRAGVDEHALSRAGGQHEGIPLPDVAGDHHRVGQRPAPRRLPDRPPDQDDPQQRGKGQRTHPRPAHQRPGPRPQQHGQQQRAWGAGRPA
ncbi:MAG: hypothetical protein JWP46_4262, partial [Modestobacter sp.]|nr:hypothetical protein [Modestobacter sp.]